MPRPKKPTSSPAYLGKIPGKTIEVHATFPPKFEPFITQRARWKCVRGGRGSGKSTSIAKALLIKGQQNPIRVLFVREIQQSIRESVHNLLEEQITELGLQQF